MSKLAYTVGRIFIAVVFLVSGYRKFMEVKVVANLLAARGVPLPDEITLWTGMPKFEALGYLAAGIEVVGGLMLVFGSGTRIAAIVLFVFTLGTIYISHDFWNMAGPAVAANVTLALQNLAIMGGLLLLAAGVVPASSEQRQHEF